MSESKIILLHLTDLHFGDVHSTSMSLQNFSYNDIALLIAETLRAKFSENKMIVALGGDLTNKGEPRKYQYAHEFLRTLQDNLKGYEIDFILCPGNHDIGTGKENCFSEFNIFTGELTRKEDFIYTDTKTSVVFEKYNLAFVSANSVFHKEHKYGFIETNELKKNFSNSKKPIIFLTHHHLIPMFKDDISAIRNAYDVIRLCQEYNVKLVLHGHIHSSFKLDLANGLSIVGCGAPLPQLGSNYNNQFNVIKLTNTGVEEIINYRIIYDSTINHNAQVFTTNL